jgi:hypothetical protein
MARPTDKSVCGRRIQQKNRQMAIRKAHDFDLVGAVVVVGNSNNPH